MMIYISVSENLSSILKNAIAVNELKPRENSNGTKVFIGTAEFGSDFIFVRMIVENRTQKLFDYDILYAINKKSIKKEDARPRRSDYLVNKGSKTSSTISISDMHEIVCCSCFNKDRDRRHGEYGTPKWCTDITVTCL